jgi:hypothetical protein
MTNPTAANQPTIMTMRQFLFLKWLYIRKKCNEFCNLTGTDVSCFNCLNRKGICLNGVIPASYFYKKVGRQYYDCKRVLDTILKQGLVAQHNHDGKDYHVFYEITPAGILVIDQFEEFYALRCTIPQIKEKKSN